MELMQANRQWSSRPADERFTSLPAMADHFATLRANSRAVVCPSRKLEAVPDADHKGLSIQGPNGHAYAPTHYAFGQLASLAGAPSDYLRRIPADIAADCLNYGFQFKRDERDVGVLLTRPANGIATADPFIRAATGPNYGRIWNNTIVNGLVDRFGDGITGTWRVPGEFGRDVTVTKENTTLFAGDRDMFVFLADERNRIEIPNRRDGRPGSLARGFFVWNSEVGAATFGIGTFLFDYVCCNRIVWGAKEYKEIKIRHTSGAPDRFLQEVAPALAAYSEGSAASVVKAIEHAREARLDNVGDFLAKRYGKAAAKDYVEIHKEEEGRPIETLWDVSTAMTAFARTVKYQNERVAIEREAGLIIDMAA